MKPSSAAVLRLLREQGKEGVTPALALTEVGTMRLAARISELREEGYVITTYDHRTATGKHVARYVLRHDEPVQLALVAS
jgi:PIN domain nuclease of toxin-antitoxin system